MESAVQAYQEGGIIAYPTEAVFGLGCDPTNQAAVEKLLSIKQRPIEKGLILLAANYSQLLPFVDDSLIPQDKRFSVLSRWPDGITQVLPAKADVPAFLTGKFSSIAVRVTSQPDVVALCNEVTVPVFHDDVRVWEVTDKTSGEHIGLWYLDPFSRKGKRSGAWATTLRIDLHTPP